MNQNIQIHCLIEQTEKIGAFTDDFAFIELLPLSQNEYVLAAFTKTNDPLNCFLDQNEFIRDIVKRAKQNPNETILVKIQKKILQGLIQSNKICVSNVSSINQKIFSKIMIKLQMPEIILKTQVISLEVIGFKYNSHSRIKYSKLKKSILYLQENDMNELYQEIEHQKKRFLSLYDKKDWNNATQYFSVLSIEIEPIIKINKLKSHHFAIKKISEATCRKEQIFQIFNIEEKECGLLRSLTNLKNRLQTGDKNTKQFRITNWSLIPQKIANPHIFLKTTSKDKYLKYFTKGSYEYYHYSDQQFNDQGWGCAYRSLQTVLSWFQLRGNYTAGPMLSIPQIQELIDRINIGGQQKIKGTRQWIGATEVSWIIQKIIGINCKILHASDGKDVLTHCQQFRSHLERVGSPIMYGGGEYAYSIVGLNYNWKLGDCQFLILDPHYSGTDSIDKIIEKKGVCWRKAQEMFKKGIFYNFCLPLLQ